MPGMETTSETLQKHPLAWACSQISMQSSSFLYFMHSCTPSAELENPPPTSAQIPSFHLPPPPQKISPPTPPRPLPRPHRSPPRPHIPLPPPNPPPKPLSPAAHLPHPTPGDPPHKPTPLPPPGAHLPLQHQLASSPSNPCKIKYKPLAPSGSHAPDARAPGMRGAGFWLLELVVPTLCHYAEVWVWVWDGELARFVGGARRG